MSVDLHWENLNAALADSLIELLNQQLANVARPSFIGPVEVTSFDFGTAPPDVEVVDLRGIHPDFLEEDDKKNPGANVVKEEGEEDFEWVSRRAMRGKGMQDGYLPPYAVPPGPMMDMFGSTPALNSAWNPGLTNLLDLRASYPSMAPPYPVYRHSMYSNPSSSSHATPPLEIQHTNSQPKPPEPTSDPSPPASPTDHPNLQVHLHITWQSNLRLTLTTSLLINYPSQMFMSLPIKLSVTGLLFNGQIAVAYQGDKRRVHLCILDEQDPYGLSATYTAKPPTTPPEPIDEDISISPPCGPHPQFPPALRSSNSGSIDKRLPIGQRLLPNIYIESEIGQADKHVLKNVTRVEKFIQDVIRKTVEEELVFPNFHTLVLGEP